MYWTNADLKSRARQQLKGRWGVYLLITFLYTIICNIVSYLADLVLPTYTDLGAWAESQYLKAMNMEQLARESGLNALLDLELTRRDIFINLGVSIVNLLLTIFVYQILVVGLNRWYMETRGGRSVVSTLFSGFSNGEQWRNVAWVRFCTMLYTYLWSLLFVIPGIVYAYKIILVPYLLAENPYMSKKRAIELSRTLTQGEKMHIFGLQLSFFGWFLLVGLCVGIASTISSVLGTAAMFIGMLFVAPYFNATMAELYATLREKAFQQGYSDATELAGFAAQ